MASQIHLQPYPQADVSAYHVSTPPPYGSNSAHQQPQSSSGYSQSSYSPYGDHPPASLCARPIAWVPLLKRSL